MIAVTDEILKQIVQAIVQAVSPEQIILFGSRANPDAPSQSDLDLLIVEREPFDTGRSRRTEIARIRRALSAFRIPKDILLFATDEVDRWRTSPNHIIARCLRQGRVLYERS